jgi:hypothetical protein
MQSGYGHRAKLDELFGPKTYAPQDDASSAYYRNVRTFRYADTDLYMPEHLRIGRAFDSAETVRIHFKWLNDEGKVVIGYCGKHLPQQA